MIWEEEVLLGQVTLNISSFMDSSDLAMTMGLTLQLFPRCLKENAALSLAGLGIGESHSRSSKNVIPSTQKQKETLSYFTEEKDCPLIFRDSIIHER